MKSRSLALLLLTCSTEHTLVCSTVLALYQQCWQPCMGQGTAPATSYAFAGARIRFKSGVFCFTRGIILKAINTCNISHFIQTHTHTHTHTHCYSVTRKHKNPRGILAEDNFFHKLYSFPLDVNKVEAVIFSLYNTYIGTECVGCCGATS